MGALTNDVFDGGFIVNLIKFNYVGVFQFFQNFDFSVNFSEIVRVETSFIDDFQCNLKFYLVLNKT